MNRLEEIKEKIIEKIDQYDAFLIGIGESFGKRIVIDKTNTSQDVLDGYYKKAKDKTYYSDILGMYNQLNELISNKNYFIVDTNVDGIIYDSHLNKTRIVTPCGNINNRQCSCEGIEGIKKFEELGDTLICPTCNQSYTYNLHGVKPYNENSYLHQWNLYHKWLSGSLNKKLLIIEIGCGFEYASITRWPFEKTAFINEKSYMIRINKNFSQSVPELRDKTLSVDEDICELFNMGN